MCVDAADDDVVDGDCGVEGCGGGGGADYSAGDCFFAFELVGVGEVAEFDVGVVGGFELFGVDGDGCAEGELALGVVVASVVVIRVAASGMFSQRVLKY